MGAQAFFYLQILLVVGLVLLVGRVLLISPKSKFKLREADRKKVAKDNDNLATAKLRQTLLLTGINIDGAPHEVLGVRKDASRSEIEAAYKKLIKKYHPDQMGPAGSAAWKDAEKVAVAINRAKDELLRRH